MYARVRPAVVGGSRVSVFDSAGLDSQYSIPYNSAYVYMRV